MGDLSDLIASQSIERQLDLNRAYAGINAEVAKLLQQISEDVKVKLAREGELTDFRRDRVARILAEIQQIVGGAYDGVEDLLRPALEELAAQEAFWARNSVNAAVEVNLLRALPSAGYLTKLVTDGLFEGSPLEGWINKQSVDTRFKVEQQIRMGLAQSETNAEIVQRLAGSKRKGLVGVLDVSRRNAETLVLTAAQTVTQRASMAVYQDNDAILKGYEQISTLDGRTSDVCIAYSGKAWNKALQPVGHKLPFNQGCPRHPRCRSRILPRTKTFRELGIEIDELPTTTRASLDGPVAADMTFERFLEKKGKVFADETLGPGRAELWRAGKINLSQLVDGRGNPLSLAQLKQKYGG